MTSKVVRQTVDLAAFPDLVIIYLGMRVNAWMGVRTLLGIGPQITNAVDRKPDGLLLHEYFLFSLIPPHLGMRQYWRDFDALEAWSRSAPHRDWWQDFLRSSGGTGFWHETYFMRGGMEAVYDDVQCRWGWDGSHRCKPHADRCSRREPARRLPARRLPPRSPRPSSTAARRPRGSGKAMRNSA